MKTVVTHMQRLLDADMSRLHAAIDGLEAFVIKGLKNQLNEDNKKSQTTLSKVKKRYEEFVRTFEQLDATYNGAIGQVNGFNDKFVSDDVERLTEIESLKERLTEEQESISSTASEDGSQSLL